MAVPAPTGLSTGGRAPGWRPLAITRRVAGLSVALLVLLVVSGGLVGPLRAAGSLASFESSPRPVETLAEPGPHAVVALEVEVPRTRGGDGTFGARVLVPLPVPGGPSAALPALAFGHGYLADVGWYESTLAHLASWGLVVIAPRSASELFPDHSAFADDLLSALDWVVSASRTDETWPGGPVDPRALGLSGHSMGGGSALLAAAREPGVRAVATLAAAETDPSAIAAAAATPAPALFLAAADDAITPVSEHQRPMFEAKASGPAQLRTILGASHCGFLDEETLVLGLVCDESAIGPEAQRRISRATLTAWLRFELAGDEAVRSLAWPDASDGATLVERRS